MQRPPGRIGSILSRSPNDWINRVSARHRDFAALGVTLDERGRLDDWLINRFVEATLQLEMSEAASASIDHPANALRDVMRLANVERRAARLTPELLIKLNGASLRGRDDHGGRSTAQAPAAYLAQAVENACDWFAVESFAELNPIEQAAIVFLRLATIQPFERANQATALIAASLFTLRAELPPMIIKPEMQASFMTARIEADQMNMQPLVELIADAVSSTLDEMIGFIKKMRAG
ncbi:MAG: Fic family protein [Blastocatellia bacterium]